MANAEPLTALSPEEMAELLQKRKAEKAAVPPQYGSVDEFADIPRTPSARISPNQSPIIPFAAPAATKGEPYDPSEYDLNMPYPNIVARAMERSGAADNLRSIGTSVVSEPSPLLPEHARKFTQRPKFDVPQAGVGTYDAFGNLGASFTTSRALQEQKRMLRQLQDPGRNVPEAGTSIGGILGDKLGQEAYQKAYESVLALTQGDEKTANQAGVDAYTAKMGELHTKGYDEVQREALVTEAFDRDKEIFLTRTMPNLANAMAREDATMLPVMKQLLRPDISFEEFITVIAQDPRALLNLLSSSLGKTSEAIILGTLGAVVGAAVGNPIAGASIGSGVGAGVSENLIGFDNALKMLAADQGIEIDMSTEEGLMDLLSRPELIEAALDMTSKRALTVGSGIAASTLGTGKVAQYLAGAIKNRAKKIGAVTAGALTTQAGGELATEAGAQVLSGEHAVQGGFDLGSLWAEPVASAGMAITPGISGVVTELQASRQATFDALKNATINDNVLRDDHVKAEKEFVDYIKKNYPDAIIDPKLRSRMSEDGVEIYDQGKYHSKDGTISISLRSVIANSTSPSEVKSRVDEILGRHERFHQVMGQYRARGDVEDDPVRDFHDANQDTILKWLESNTAYEINLEAYLSGDEAAILAVTEEYINSQGESDTGFLSGTKLWIMDAAKKLGMETSPDEDARLLLQRMLRENKSLRVRNPYSPESTQAGGLQSKSRRDFMRKMGIAGAGVAIDPSVVLEPGGIPPAETVVPQFSGFGAGPSAFPEMEGVLRAGIADAVPTPGLVSQREVFDNVDVDDFSDIEAQEQRLKEFEDNQVKEKKAIEDERAADQEKFIKAVEEVISIYDDDVLITDDLKSGALNERIKAIAADTGYPEAELSRAVQNYIEDLTETETEVDMFASIARKDMSDVQVTTRNFNDFVAKRGRAAMKGDAGKLSLLDRLRKIAGAPATKLRGDEQAADTEEYIALARQIAAGDTENVVAFLDEQEAILAAFKTDRDLLKIQKQQQTYADSVGKDVKDLAPRRSNVPPYEKFISPKLAMDMAQQQFDDGKITAKQLETIKGKIGEAQTTIKTTGKSKAALTDALRAEGIEITGQELKYWSEQAEIIGRKQVPAEVKKQEARPKQEVRDELDKIYKDMEKAGVEVTRIPSFDQHVFKPDATVGPRVKAVGWIDDLADPTWAADDQVEIEGERYEGFQVDDFADLNASVVANGVPLKEGNEAFDAKGNKYIITSFDEDGFVSTMMQKKPGGALVPTRVKPSQLTGTENKADTQRNTDFRNLNREINNDKKIDKLTKQEAKKLTLAWYEQDGTQIPDRWKRKLLPIMFGPNVNNELAAFISSMNKALGPKVMATDHSVELDEFFTPGVVKALINGSAGAEATSRAAELLSETNLTFTWQAINNLKKTLRSPRSKLSQADRDARDVALNGWYELLDANLDTMNFVDAHNATLQQWIKKHGDVLPKGSVYSNDLSRLSDVLGKGINVSNAAQVNALYGPNTELFAAYKNNLKTKGVLPTKDKVFVQQFENAVKQEVKMYASVVKKDGEVDTRKVDAKFTNYTAYNWLQFVFGRPVMAVDAFNRESVLGGKMTGDVPIASVIANIIYRNPAASGRPEGMETGTDMVQEMSMRTGEFNSRLSKIFSGLTNNEGVITPETNALIIDHLVGKEVKFPNDAVAKAATELKTFLEDMYQYSKDRTDHLETPIDLRGAGDTVLPRVWNTEYISTKEGKEQFLKAVSDKFTDPEGRSIFEEIDITPEDLYTMVVNSGGFVQGDWRQIAQDQNTSKKEIEKAELIQEYLDSLSTEELVESGLVIDDIQAVLPRFVQKAIRRTEYSAVFGSKDEILRSLIQIGVDQIKVHNEKVLGTSKDAGGEIIDEKKFVKAVWDMSNILRNKYGYESADLPTRRWLQRVSNIETIAKLPFVTLASLPEFFTPMLKGDVRPDKFLVDLGMATAFAGYKGINGVSKLLFNKHLPAMLKHSSEIGGLGIISDIQLLRELGIADIQAMGDIASTRYVNPSFAPGGIKSGAKGTLGARVPKSVRAVFNMQTYMQATMLTTITEMQQFMALRNFQRHMGSRIKAVNESKGKTLKGKRATNRLKQFKQDMLDYGLTEDIDFNTAEGQAAFEAATLRFVDQVITRPNDATTAKIFKNPLTAPLVLFKRFITTYGNTLLTSVGRNMADKVDNVERAKQVGKLSVAGASMYGAVMFAEMIRAAIKGDLDDEDFAIVPDDFKTFLRRIDRMGVLGAPGSMAANLTFPSKAWYGDTGTNRLVRELTGPLGSDMAGTLDFLMSKKGERDLRKLLGQIAPVSRQVLPKQNKTKKKRKNKGPVGGFE